MATPIIVNAQIEFILVHRLEIPEFMRFSMVAAYSLNSVTPKFDTIRLLFRYVYL